MTAGVDMGVVGTKVGATAAQQKQARLRQGGINLGTSCVVAWPEPRSGLRAKEAPVVVLSGLGWSGGEVGALRTGATSVQAGRLLRLSGFGPKRAQFLAR